jgi:anti-sigma B factor antagonist
MPNPRTVKISIRTVEAATIVDLEGDVDITTSPSLRARLLEVLPGCVRLVINMSGIRYLDSAGVATMVEARLKAKELEKHFALYGLNPKVMAVLKLTRLVGFFRVADSEEQAVQGDPAERG